MCKNCEYDPYLAGCVVIFPITKTLPVEDPAALDFPKVVGFIEQTKGYTGRCVRHHNGYVTIRTKKNSFSMKADQVLAYIPKGEK
jgi:hypothetical protein